MDQLDRIKSKTALSWKDTAKRMRGQDPGRGGYLSTTLGQRAQNPEF